jgi:hypothetical protein
MIVTAAERSDWALPTTLAGDLTTRLSEVSNTLRIVSTFEVFYSCNAGECVVGFGNPTLFDSKFDATVVDAGRCPELDV